MNFFKFFLPVFLLSAMSCNIINKSDVLFSDDFRGISRGPLGTPSGAHMEYHYLAEGRPRGNWAISTFKGEEVNWYARNDGDKRVIYQNTNKTSKFYWHPMIIAGDELWENYTLKTSFKVENKINQAGIVFRYRNDRCYYMLGIKQDTVFMKMVKHATALRVPYEKVLDAKEFDYTLNEEIRVEIKVENSQLTAKIENGPELSAVDTTYKKGKIGFTADCPATFYPVEITSSKKDIASYKKIRSEYDDVEKQLQDKNPKPVVWKKINTGKFGTGRNLRFGDLNNDGTIDILIGQIVHHGRRNNNSELSCMTAMTFDGEVLWQKGDQDSWKTYLTNDVAFQIHDINNDGVNEVIYTMNHKLIVADAKTGKTKYQISTPLNPDYDPNYTDSKYKYKRIFGDCLFFCDIEGKGYDGNLLIKNRYKYLWVYNNKLELLWKSECVTGHYPYAYDVDNDGKDELMMGYTLFDDNGDKLWHMEDTVIDHADGVAIAKFKQDEEPHLLCAASDEGMFFTNMKGNFVKRHFIGHIQNPAIANFRDDKPGLEALSVNFWGNQGIIHLYDSDFNIYHDFEPHQYGSMCLPLNWTGKSEEFYILNVNVEEGGAYDGWGRKVVEFPDDGHPDMCYATLDITGDCRDEIVVWDPEQLWVYTQDDNPKKGKLFKPERNQLYNYSNYQSTVSLPGWHND